MTKGQISAIDIDLEGRFVFRVAKADAFLFKAASDMYGALKMAREELCFGGDWETTKAKIDKALAKAEGK